MVTIGCFPHLYPDELLYSGIARMRDRLQYPNQSSLKEELFGNKGTTVSIEFASNINTLISRLPQNIPYTVDHLIDNHTLLPFYQPFLPSERIDKIKDSICAGGSIGLYASLGTVRSKVDSPSFLRYCSECIALDREHYGECYWHRVHQLTGVELCPYHEIELGFSSVAMRSQTNHNKKYVSAETCVPATFSVPKSIPEPTKTILLNLARDILWLLKNPTQPLGLQYLSDLYKTMLRDFQRLSSTAGQVYMARLIVLLESYYPEQVLRLLPSNWNSRSGYQWRGLRVWNPAAVSHPLYHLLVIGLLGCTVDEFLKGEVRRNPFGNGPWPCFNPIKSYDDQNHSVSCVLIKRSTGVISGEFTCDCGFKYLRSTANTTGSETGQIIEYGALWENTLRSLWSNAEISLTQMSTRLRVSKSSLNQHALRLGLSFPRPAIRRVEAKIHRPRPNLPVCPRCVGTHITKHGHRNARQRYRCHSCGATFS